VALIIAFAVALVLTPLIARLALRLGVVDRPGPLKVQAQPVPYLGGVAVFAALACPVATERPSVLIPLGLAALLGLADDVGDLPVPVRIAGEVVIGITAALTVPARGPLAALATVAFVLVLLNAVNLLDGLDGLAAGVGTTAALGFAVALDGTFAIVALALAGALFGFLVWNRPPARIYLGDAGSYLIGTALAVLLAAAWGPGESVPLGAGSLLFVGVPVADTAIAIIRRRRAHRPLFVGDRGHVYDQLVDGGWSPTRVTIACVGAQVLFVALGIGIMSLPAAVALVASGVSIGLVAWFALRTFASPESWSA
jgi:UDP-GlcNAc:undecaprenyl-phosphate GlcNAc-1-phosphate transferase